MSPSDFDTHVHRHMHPITHTHTMLSAVKRGGIAARVEGCLPSVQMTQTEFHPSTAHPDNLGIWKVVA
jgi:hypothetical protein